MKCIDCNTPCDDKGPNTTGCTRNPTQDEVMNRRNREEKSAAAGAAAIRPLSAIAIDIIRNWPKPYFGAVPYITAMSALDSITDNYGCDSAKSIVLYFLSNAGTWRGPEAKRIKTELKKMAGIK